MEIRIIYLILLCLITFNLKSENHISNNKCLELKNYCIKHKFNSDVCILVDFSEYSGNERLYIYNLNTNNIKSSGRVAHGIGKKGNFLNPNFSNKINSWESSLGRYKTGRLRTLNIPQFNNVPCIEVHGLDPTNSNAHRRGIVIHPGLLTSKKTVTPCEPLSQGCFTVGQETFDAIKNLVKNSKKPILLYVYN